MAEPRGEQQTALHGYPSGREGRVVQRLRAGPLAQRVELKLAARRGLARVHVRGEPAPQVRMLCGGKTHTAQVRVRNGLRVRVRVRVRVRARARAGVRARARGRARARVRAG